VDRAGCPSGGCTTAERREVSHGRRVDREEASRLVRVWNQDHRENKPPVLAGASAAGDVMRTSMTEQDPLEVSLEDHELLAEVELLTNLIVAATDADDALDQRDIDEVLDVRK
jgi:hypothetical protein